MFRISNRQPSRQRGAALLTVLWLTAALAVIGLSVAAMVRGEVGRVENSLDGARAEMLARGAFERLMHFYANPPAPQPGKAREFREGQQRMYWSFPGGDVLVEILPEAGKLDVNNATLQQLVALMLAAGYPGPVATGVAEAIIDRRTLPPGGVSLLDSYYLSIHPTFRPRHASFQQIEELLMVRGVTPHIYYGGLERVPGGAVVETTGLRDLLSVYGTTGTFDVNSAHPAVLRMAGLAPGDIDMIVQMRRQVPFTSVTLATLPLSTGPASRVLRADYDRAYTVKATARPRRSDGGLSDFRGTAAMLIAYEQEGNFQAIRTKAWYGTATTDTPWPEPSPEVVR